MNEKVKAKLDAFQHKVVQEALQGKPYSPRTSADVPVPERIKGLKAEVIAEGAALLSVEPYVFEEASVSLPSPDAPAVSGESSPTQDSGDTEQQR